MKYKYEKFEDYFEEIEGYGERGERFFWEFEELPIERRRRMKEWLKAAFECGREENQNGRE
jgi:hypothetical protein